jgi:hypothetical protein
MASQTADRRPRLTVAMIVRDEQESLPQALESIRDIADEVVVVDTGSRDATPRIATRLGARLVQSPWQNDFSQARNRALSEATGDWILWLDAGERLSRRCAGPLREFIDSRPEANTAWLCMIELPAEHGDGLAEQVGRIRLVPRDSRLRFSGRIRETLRPALAQAGMAVDVGPWKILRTAREHDFEIKRGKALRDLRLIELELQQRGPTPTLLTALGEIENALGNHGKAAASFRQAIAMSARGSTEMLSAYYGLLTSFPSGAAPGNDQLEVCIEALEVFPYDAQLLCALGSYLQAQGQASLAQRSYRAAHQFGQVDPETWHIAAIGEVAAICLSLALQLSGDDHEAARVLDEARARYPRSSRLGRRRLELYVKHGHTAEALDLVPLVQADAHDQDLLRDAVRGACLASQQNWISAIGYLQAAYSAGCRDAVCLRWYAISLFSTGQKEAAAGVMADWAKVEPNCGELAGYQAALANDAADRSIRPPTANPTRRGFVPPPHVLEARSAGQLFGNRR